jgi:hypothetical protein
MSLNSPLPLVGRAVTLQPTNNQRVSHGSHHVNRTNHGG